MSGSAALPEATSPGCIVINVVVPAVLLWGLNVLWLTLDSRPPVWDMAMHQSYALNYLPDSHSPSPGTGARPWALSGIYPPFVHLVIALCYLVAHAGPHVAVLANIPATLLLFWSICELAREWAGPTAARWACLLTALTPYLIWMSRETILDYWLSAWVAASLVLLRRTHGFELRVPSILFGCALALGLLTKWLFAGFLVFPLVYVLVRHRLWHDRARLVNLADALLVAGLVAGIWYLPNMPRLIRYFGENTRIGAREGEPRVLSFQSFIYYLRLLEGYQLFALLFVLLILSCVFVWKAGLLRDAKFLVVALAGGWLVMTLIRTKDPRFTMPLLGLLAIVPGAWIQSWKASWLTRLAKGVILALLGLQAYAINFGISWLPQEVILARGYEGSLRWDWNLYLQHYFHILGTPRREDWKQAEILRKMAEDARQRGLGLSLAVIPDLPRFSAANFHLYSRLLGIRARVDHLQSGGGVRSFDGFDYAVMSDGEQGMSWTTTSSRALNQIVMDEVQVFRLVELYPLPNGDYARLYAIERGRN